MLFILEFLPSWVFLALFGIGVLTFLLTYFLKFVPIPFVYTHKIWIQIASIALIVFSTFMYGGSYNNDAWLAKVKEMEEKVAAAEAKANEKNIQIEEKIVEKTKVVKEKGEEIIKYIDREVIKKEEVVKFVENCPIPKDIVDLHNQATKMTGQGEKK
jgi:membrane protein implicated in regulation of membrane protease activity